MQLFWRNQPNFAALKSAMAIARFAQCLHRIPNFFYGIGSVFRRFMAYPSKNFDKAGFVVLFFFPNNDMRLGKY